MNEKEVLIIIFPPIGEIWKKFGAHAKSLLCLNCNSLQMYDLLKLSKI